MFDNVKSYYIIIVYPYILKQDICTYILFMCIRMHE